MYFVTFFFPDMSFHVPPWLVLIIVANLSSSDSVHVLDFMNNKIERGLPLMMMQPVVALGLDLNELLNLQDIRK